KARIVLPTRVLSAECRVLSSNPEGLHRLAQGCRLRLPWESATAISGNPEGVAIELVKRAFAGCGRNPFGVETRRSALASLSIDQTRNEARTEAVVDVHHRDIGGAGIKHAQESSYASKRRAVADARRHGDDRHRHHAAHHRR